MKPTGVQSYQEYGQIYDAQLARRSANQFFLATEAAVVGLAATGALLIGAATQAENSPGYFEVDPPSNEIVTPTQQPNIDLSQGKYGRVVIHLATVEGSTLPSPEKIAAMPDIVEEAIQLLDDATDGKLIEWDIPIVQGEILTLTKTGNLSQVCGDDDTFRLFTDNIVDEVREQSPREKGDLVITVMDKPDDFVCDAKTNYKGADAVRPARGQVIILDADKVSAGVIAHEVNHDEYGHDNSLNCLDPVPEITDECIVYEYGNPTTIAGNGAYGTESRGDPDLITGFEQRVFGILTPEQVYTVLPGENKVDIKALADAGEGVKIIRVPLSGFELSPRGTDAIIKPSALYIELSTDLLLDNGKRNISVKTYLVNEEVLDDPSLQATSTYLLDYSSDIRAFGLVAKDIGKPVNFTFGNTKVDVELQKLVAGSSVGSGGASVSVTLR